MKNKPYTILFFAITSTILSSCYEIPSISLTKRHYRNGYNLEVNEKKTPTPTQLIKSNKSEFAGPKDPERGKSQFALLKNADGDNNKIIPISFKDNTVKTKENKNNYTRKIYVKNKKNILNNNNLRFLSKTVSIIKTILKKPIIFKNLIIKNKTNDHEGEEHHHGGLIWTLICVFFILWLLSLLTGGGD